MPGQSLEHGTSLGHCLWSSSGVRTGVLSHRGNIMCSSEMLMHTKSGRKLDFGGKFMARFLIAGAQSEFQSRAALWCSSLYAAAPSLLSLVWSHQFLQFCATMPRGIYSGLGKGKLIAAEGLFCAVEETQGQSP